MKYRSRRLASSSLTNAKWNHPEWQNSSILHLNHYMGESPTHRPKVEIRIGWYMDAVNIIFRVEDQYVLAKAQNHHDPVYRDSCVEFFFTPGLALGRSYFNLEMNCGGTMLFWWHPEDGEAVPISLDDCNQIEVAHSLPTAIDVEIALPVVWTLEYSLPFEIIRTYCPRAEPPAPRVVWKANFYKCADASSHPHWLTWAPVDHPTPNFHLPEYFGELIFEAS